MKFTQEDMNKIRQEKYSNISKFEYDEKNKLLFVESILEGKNKSIEIYTTNNSMQKALFYPNHPKLLFRHDRNEIFQKDLEELLTEKYGIKTEEVIQLHNEYFMFDENKAEMLREMRYSNRNNFEYNEKQKLLYVTIKKNSRESDGNWYANDDFRSKSNCINIYNSKNGNVVCALEIDKKTFHIYSPKEIKIERGVINAKSQNKSLSSKIKSIIATLEEKGCKFKIDNDPLGQFYWFKMIPDDCLVPTQAYWERENILHSRMNKKFEAERKAMIVSEEKMRKRFTI
ncbi:MAG: hypothetical protein PHU51_00735 [Candidatus Nanoarchaeia archaeon]|nr:hypothetical protein [Candidatus Nanoarchaeia archaeon]